MDTLGNPTHDMTYFVPSPVVETPEGVCYLDSYDQIVVMFSGGKDSLACLLWAIEHFQEDKIVLWHQSVDGLSSKPFMDWECTEGYCKAIAHHFGVPIRFQWKEGGFLGEALRDNEPTAAICFESEELDEDGNRIYYRTGGQGKVNTRLKFPQISANLSTRWCSGYLKVDVAASALRHLPQFNDSRTLVLTGERREESAARAKYKAFEPHRAHSVGRRTKRHIDHLRPVIEWDETKVWNLIEDYNLRAHPAYYLGWSRCSCKGCIFLNADGFASVKKLSPEQFEYLAVTEEVFGHTLKRDTDLRSLADKGIPYAALNDPMLESVALQAVQETWWLPITMGDAWYMPAGAFGDSSCGPS